ncbi:MAG: hypothetical protein IKJ98_01880 [Bacteroidales bacterium]|nr:hypothetical protein [Bacteroidales bacterium]
MKGINNRKKLESLLFQEMDLAEEQNGVKVTKILVDLFKTVMLEKYKVAFNEEMKQGVVHKENIDKYVDFCFYEACVSYRKMSIIGLGDKDKDNEIQKLKKNLYEIKRIVYEGIESKDVQIIE